MKINIVIDENICTGCSTCVDNCSTGSLYIDPREAVSRVLDHSSCIRSGTCESLCPTEAIKLYRP